MKLLSLLTSVVPAPYGFLVRWGLIAALAAALLLYGFTKGVDHQQTVDEAAAAKTLQQELTAERAATNKAVADAAAKLQAEQGKSAELQDSLATITHNADELREELRRVSFHVPSVAPVNGVCAGNPVDSPDFIRLYNAAALGDAGTTTSDPYPATSGMPANGAGQNAAQPGTAP